MDHNTTTRTSVAMDGAGAACNCYLLIISPMLSHIDCLLQLYRYEYTQYALNGENMAWEKYIDTVNQEESTATAKSICKSSPK